MDRDRGGGAGPTADEGVEESNSAPVAGCTCGEIVLVSTRSSLPSNDGPSIPISLPNVAGILFRLTHIFPSDLSTNAVQRHFESLALEPHCYAGVISNGTPPGRTLPVNRITGQD